MKIVQESPYRFRIEPQGAMRVPGIIVATRGLLPDPAADKSVMQVVDVAALPSIVIASYAMPDMHWGYGSATGFVGPDREALICTHRTWRVTSYEPGQRPHHCLVHRPAGACRPARSM